MAKFYLRDTVVEAVQYTGQLLPGGKINATDRAWLMEVGGMQCLVRPGEIAVPVMAGVHRGTASVVLSKGDWLVTYGNGTSGRVPGALMLEAYGPIVEVDGETSDGYHTFNELYAHRHALFALLLKQYAHLGFKTRLTADGRESPGWFIAAIDAPCGQISYHMPDAWWDKLPFLRVAERNSSYDGHTAKDVVQRLETLALQEVFLESEEVTPV